MTALHKLAKIALIPLMAASLGAATTYTVKSGDTLSSIARRNGTTVAKLMSLNGIKDPSKILVGQNLKLSSQAAPKPTPKKNTPKANGSYTVKSGDTFYSIAKKSGISVASLKALNPNIEPSSISVGQKLAISGNAKPTKVTNPPKPKLETRTKPIKIAAQLNEPKPLPSPTPTPQTESPRPKPTEKPPVTKNKEEQAPTPVPSHVSSVIIEKEISYGALASRHRTSTKQLNALNGWNFKPTTIFARGSEVYVPGNQ